MLTKMKCVLSAVQVFQAIGFKDASVQCNLPKLKRVRGHDIKLQVDGNGNGEPHMEPESDDNESEDSYSCSSDSEETEEYELDAKEKSSV